MANEFERFLKKVKKLPSGCWMWTACKNRKGYGSFGFKNGKCLTGPAHVYSYLTFRGSIPQGMVLDHICDNKWCVNPHHLVPTTSRINTLRGDTPAGRNYRKTHCYKGHEFSPENTWMYYPRTRNNPTRKCKKCGALALRKYRAKKKQKEAT